MSDEELKNNASELVEQLRKLYKKFDAEFTETDRKAIAKKLDENEREAEHEKQNRNFEKLFQRRYLENSLSIERAAIHSLSKFRILGSATIPMGTKLGLGAVRVVMYKGKPVHDPDSPAEFLAGEPWLLFLIG